MSDLEPLSDLARELLDEERSAIGAQPELSGRVMAKLEAALGPTLGFGADGTGGGHHGGEGGAGPGGAAPPAAGAGAGAGAALGGAKLAAVIATTFAVGTGAGVAVDRSMAVPAPTVTVYLPAAPAPSTTMIPVGITSASASASTSAAPTAAPRATATAATTSDPKSDLARERELIDAARAGVARGHAEAALSAVSRHEREFPQGQLREEREGLRILALAAQGRTTEARTFAARFRKSYPQSVLLPQIDAALGVP
jgi:hypothetical protein